jgi:hypothetical protein
MSAQARLAAAGITYRQLDNWIRQGWVRPTGMGGTGHPRGWPSRELAIALLMKRLTDSGFSPRVAADLARTAETLRSMYALTNDQPVPVDLGGGLELTINPTRQEAAA